MIKRMLLMLVVLILVIGGIFGYKIFTGIMMGKMMASMPIPPVTVTATEAKMMDWKPAIRVIGTVEAVNGVKLGAEINGRITEILFESGARVEKDTPLVKLDTKREEAELKRAEAQLALATSNLQRAEELRSKQANAKADYDNAVGERDKAQAELNMIQVQIDKKTIEAPFAGLLGIREANLGQQLEMGDPIVWIQSIDPVYVNFAIPQQRLAQVTAGQKIAVTSDSFPGETFEGAINVVSPSIDEATRNIRIQAILKNPEQKLRPGMFVNVEVLLPGETEFVTIPVTSVSYNPYGNFVYILEPKKDEAGVEFTGIRIQPVKLGDRRGDQVAVLSGVNVGETVATSGLIKLRPDVRVVVNNTVTPSYEADPTPTDS